MVKQPDEERPMLNAAAIQPAAEPPQGELARVFRENAQRVLAAAYRVTGSAQDAEDVLQTVFLRLVKSGGGARLGDDPGRYLRRAAVNAGVDVLRSRRGAQETPLEKVEACLPDSGQAGPDRLQGTSELGEQIRKVLATLSPRSAEIFALRYFEGYDNHEIAKMLGTSRSTVGVILHRTRQQLRDAIREYVGE